MYNVNQISLHGKLLKDIDIDTLSSMPSHVPSSKLVKQKLDKIGNQIKSEIEIYELTTISTDEFVPVPKHEGLFIKQGTWTVTDYGVANDYSYTSNARTVSGLMVKLGNDFPSTIYEVPKKIYMRDVEWDIKIVALKADNWARWTNIYAPDVSIFERSDATEPIVLLDNDTVDKKIHRLDITCRDFEPSIISEAKKHMDIRCETDQSWRVILHGVQSVDMESFESNYKGSLIIDSDVNAAIRNTCACIRDITLPTNNYCVGTGAFTTTMTVKIPKGSRLSYDLNQLGTKNLRIDCYEPDYFLRIGPVIGETGVVIYEHPVDRFRLLNEEEHLMERIYRYKSNVFNDMNFFRNCEGYEQTFKVGITPAVATHTFEYTQDTERTPAKVFLSNWLYDMKDEEYKLVAYTTETLTDVEYRTDETHTTIMPCKYGDAYVGYMAFRSKFPDSGRPLKIVDNVPTPITSYDDLTEGSEWVCVETAATTDMEELVGKSILYVEGLTAEEQAQSTVVINRTHVIKAGQWSAIKAATGAGLVAKTNAEDLFIIPMAFVDPANEYEFMYLKQKVTHTGNKTVTFTTAKEIKLSAQIRGLVVDVSGCSAGAMVIYPNIESLQHVVFAAGQSANNELYITEQNLNEVDISTANANFDTLRLGYTAVMRLLQTAKVVALGPKIKSTCTVFVPENFDIPKIKELLSLSASQNVESYSQRHDY
jgi:hypothetical protein